MVVALKTDVVTLDVRNAFNSLNLGCVKSTLAKLIESNRSERFLWYGTKDQHKKTLWQPVNPKALLSIQVSKETTLISFADDLSTTAVVKHPEGVVVYESENTHVIKA